MRLSTGYSLYWLHARALELADGQANKSQNAIAKNSQVSRPVGRLIWVHAARLADARELSELLSKLVVDQPDLRFLLTLEDMEGVSESRMIAELNITVAPMPKDRPAAVRGFMDHWHADLLLWASETRMPILLGAARKKGLFTILVNADVNAKQYSRMVWFPNFSGLYLSRFNRILARSSAAANYLRKLNAPRTRMEVVGPMQSGARALPYDEEERTKIANLIGTRPIWLASNVTQGEIAMVGKAQRRVARHAQRLLLILHLDDLNRASNAKMRLDALRLKTTLLSGSGAGLQNADVLIADQENKLGMLYRLAPVCFMGGSLVDTGGNDPFEAAALGSAIMHGPSVDNFQDSYDRLADVGAAIRITNSESLAQTLSQILSPDKAASMAHSAWEVATAGAEVNDRLFELMKTALEKRNETAEILE